MARRSGSACNSSSTPKPSIRASAGRGGPVRRPLGDRPQRLPPVLGYVDRARPALEQLADHVGHVRVVVDHSSRRQCPAPRATGPRAGARARTASPGSPRHPGRSPGSSGRRSESRTTGMSRVAGSALSSCRTCQPSLPGMMMSRMMLPGLISRALRCPPRRPRAADHPIARLGEVLPQQLDHVRVVVDHEDRRGRPGRCRGLALRPRVAARRRHRGCGSRVRSGGASSAWRSGSRTVKVEPVPTALSTVMSPPMRRPSRRLIARPRPVPPYCRVLPLSTWRNSSKISSRQLLGDADAGVRTPRRPTVLAVLAPRAQR